MMPIAFPEIPHGDTDWIEKRIAECIARAYAEGHATGRREGQERIVMAAWKEGDAIYVVERPGRHHHIAHNLRAAGRLNGGHPLPPTSGFITSDGRYVDREEGCRIARAAGQIVQKHGPERELFSEDMW